MALRIILLGKTGSGKSSLGNSLLGKPVFKVGRGMASETAECQWEYGTRGAAVLEIVDTPGLCDTDTPEAIIYREVGKSVAVAAPGPHVLILALRCDRRFTKEEFDAYQQLRKIFSPEMSNYLIIVFNGIDSLGNTPSEQKCALEKEVEKMPGQLKQVIRDAGNRYVGMNNNASAFDKEVLLQELTIMMLDLGRQNGNSYYTTRLITDIGRYIDGLIQSQAQRSNMPHHQAVHTTKRAIVNNENGEALSTIGEMVSRVAIGIMSLCSLM